MKKVLVAAALAVMFQACNTQGEKVSDGQRIADSLRSVNEENNSVINDFLVLFNDVENELDSIAGRQKSIYLHTSKPGDVKNFFNEINADVKAINEIISSSSRKIKAINNKLKAEKRKNAELEQAIANLNSKLADKENELSDMRSKLNEYNTNIQGLTLVIGMLGAENAVLNETVNEETEMLHASYYAVGTSRELQKDSVIDRKGGLLGIGTTSKLKNNYNQKAFTKIDNMQTNLIPVNSRHITIVTSHAGDSYTLDKEGSEIKNIVITDPEKFWEASKYLVVIKNQ